MVRLSMTLPSHREEGKERRRERGEEVEEGEGGDEVEEGEGEEEVVDGEGFLKRGDSTSPDSCTLFRLGHESQELIEEGLDASMSAKI